MKGKRFASINGSYSTSFIGSWSLVRQSISGNYSIIRLYGTFRYSGGRSVGSSYSTFKLNGSTIKSSSYRYYPGDTQISTKDIKVNHKADGTFPAKKVTIFANSYHIKNKSASGTIKGVARIPRTSNFSLSTSTVTIGNSININISRASSSFTHTLKYKFGSASGTIATGVKTSKKWTLPTSLINRIPNSSSGVGTITCYTYSGSTLIGTKSRTFTAIVPSNIIPSFEKLTIERINNDVPADWGIYVKTKSSCKLKIIGAKGTYGSKIKSYSISGGGYSGSSSVLTTGILNKSGKITFTGKIIDSRGRVATKTVSIEVVDYHSPIINNIKIDRCLKNGTINSDGTYIKCEFNIDFSSCKNKNSTIKTIQYCLIGTNDYSQCENIENASVCCGGNLSINNTYNIKFSVSDQFSTTSYTTKVLTAFCTWDAKKGGKGFAIGKVSEKNGFECAMQTEFSKPVEFKNSDVKINGTTISYQQGIKDGWNYKKYDNGNLEVWREITFTVACEGKWGSISTSRDVSCSSVRYPFNFITRPFTFPALINAGGGANMFLVTNSNQPDLRFYSPNIQIGRGTSIGSAYVRLQICSKGKWK